MRISVHLRPNANQTNARSLAIGHAFEDLGEDVAYFGRNEASPNSDLVIQTGFARSIPLVDAIERQIPYIVMEAPFWRDFYDVYGASSWGYNGLAGGAWAPAAPEEERPKPNLEPMKTEGGTLIVGQKPTDHSLRGSDHIEWLLARFREFPEAAFRPHPLMVGPPGLPPLEEALSDVAFVVTYTSTVGCDAWRAGCAVRADGHGSLNHFEGSRESWHHELSWRQASHAHFGELAAFIRGGYEEAKERAARGLQEHPRERVDGQAVCQRYYRSIIR